MSDPDHFFCTEEIATSIRAFTKGYEFYHPYAPLLWHQYDNHARKVWDDQSEPPAANSATSMTLEDRSSAALRKTLALVGLPTGSEMEDFGIFGLGSQRTLRQYERHTGSTFDFEQFTSNHLCKSQSACQRPLKRMNGSGVSSTSAQCESTFPAPAALHFRPRCLSLYSSDGVRQSTRELSKSELKSLSREGQVQYFDTLRAPLDQLPVRYLVRAQRRCADGPSAFDLR